MASAAPYDSLTGRFSLGPAREGRLGYRNRLPTCDQAPGRGSSLGTVPMLMQAWLQTAGATRKVEVPAGRLRQFRGRPGTSPPGFVFRPPRFSPGPTGGSSGSGQVLSLRAFLNPHLGQAPTASCISGWRAEPVIQEPSLRLRLN